MWRFPGLNSDLGRRNMMDRDSVLEDERIMDALEENGSE